MTTGVRQKIAILIFSGLLVIMGMVGVYRYYMEKHNLIEATKTQGEEACKLMAQLAVPYLVTSDFGGLHAMVQHFIHTPNAQEITIIDREGRQIVHTTRPDMSDKRILIEPVQIVSDAVRLGEIRIAVYPAAMDRNLRASAYSTVIENVIIFLILVGTLLFTVTRSITQPLRAVVSALQEMIDRKDFSRRLIYASSDEIGKLSKGVNYLLEQLEQFIVKMGTISTRITELNPVIAVSTHEIKKNAEVEAEAVANASTSVAEMSSSIQSIAESAESLTASAEETSSAILEMNASHAEVARHSAELTSSVEDVTTSVTEMIASIREVATHVDSLSSAAEETSSSAIEIEATVREVERAASESTKLSQQVTVEAQDIGVRTIHETMSAIHTIKDAVQRYAGLVTQLGKRSEEIGKILGVIVEVTERTNLLALNASILAAQAGEYGKGFAVVAEEIKALADRTAGSAQDIAKLVSAVQKETKEAVTAMSESLTAVNEGVRRSQAAEVALNKILASSSRSAEMATMIERAMSEQARGIKQVSEAITNVKQMTEQIAGATQAQSKGTEMILHAAEEMRDIARRVKIATTEQERGGKQIAVAAENVTMRAGKIAAGTWEQQQAIQQILGSMERIKGLPHHTMKQMEGMGSAIKNLGEQSDLLRQEIASMTVRKRIRAKTGGVLQMGVIPLESPAEMYRRFSPLVEYLGRTTGKKVELSIAVDFAQTINDLEEGNTDLAFLTPTTYIEARKRCGVTLLVKALRNGVPWMHAVIAVRSDSGLTKLEDLRGKRFAFGDRMSTTSYLIPRFMLADAGIELDALKSHAFLGHHDDVAKAILEREYDGGGLRESTAKAFAERGLSVIKTSAEIPEFSICASKNLDPSAADALKKALLALNRSNTAMANILSVIDPDYTGFTTANESDYDAIRKAMEQMAKEVGPS